MLIGNCNRVNIIVDKIVGQLEIQSSKVIKISCKNQSPDKGPGAMGMLTTENCNEIVLTLSNETRNAKISTICSRSVIVKYPKEGSTDEQAAENPGEHLLSFPIAEVYETVVNKDDLVTTPMEAMD